MLNANGDELGWFPGRVDEETYDGVSRGHGEVAAEKAPPTLQRMVMLCGREARGSWLTWAQVDPRRRDFCTM